MCSIKTLAYYTPLHVTTVKSVAEFAQGGLYCIFYDSDYCNNTVSLPATFTLV
jgi:hypothetical protein